MSEQKQSVAGSNAGPCLTTLTAVEGATTPESGREPTNSPDTSFADRLFDVANSFAGDATGELAVALHHAANIARRLNAEPDARAAALLWSGETVEAAGDAREVRSHSAKFASLGDAAKRLYDNICEFGSVTDDEFLDDLERAIDVVREHHVAADSTAYGKLVGSLAEAMNSGKRFEGTVTFRDGKVVKEEARVFDDETKGR